MAKTMTPKRAAQIFKRADKAIDKLDAQQKAARVVLVPYFEESGTTEFEGVGFGVTTRKQLDTTAVRAELGDRLEKFLKPVTSRTVFVIEAK